MRQALLVGVSDYGGEKDLPSSSRDVEALEEVLKWNTAKPWTTNFNVQRAGKLRNAKHFEEILRQFFSRHVDVSLFYYSGHGETNDSSKLILSDFWETGYGLEIYKVIQLANESNARHRIVILDCCYAGGLNMLYGKLVNELKEGVTVMASCRASEESLAQSEGLSLFTRYLVNALAGAAADEKGVITLPSIFQYIDRALKPNEQRPIFWCNNSEFIPIKKIDHLEALNRFSTRIFAEIQNLQGVCHVKVVFNKEDYLKLLKQYLDLAQREVLFTSSGIGDVAQGDIGHLQKGINEAAKAFKLRNPKRLHLGIVGDRPNNYLGAVQLRAVVNDVSIKFSPSVHLLDYNVFICDEKYVVIRLKNHSSVLGDYAVAIENESLADKMRDLFMAIWHMETSRLMYVELNAHIESDAYHRDRIIESVFDGDNRSFEVFMQRLTIIDLTHRVVEARKSKMVKMVKPLEIFQNEMQDPQSIANVAKLIENFYKESKFTLTDIQMVINSIDQGNAINYSLYSRAFTFQFFLANYYKVRHAFWEVSKRHSLRQGDLSVVDLGGGGGASLAAMFDHFASRPGNKLPTKVTLLDNSKEQVEIAKAILENYPQVDVLFEDVASFLRRPGDKYDLIISSNFLCEITKNERPDILRRIANRLPTEGFFLVVERVESRVYDAIMDIGCYMLKDYKFVNERWEIPTRQLWAIKSILERGDKIVEHVKSNYTLRYALCTAKPS
jgi:phospholipid N-methyltransferase